jgi:uncharacterized lipoprotein
MKMRNLKLSIIFVFMILSVVGCGSAVDKIDIDDEYKKAAPHDKSLALPSDIDGNVIEDYYPVPKVENSKQKVNVSIVPPQVAR